MAEKSELFGAIADFYQSSMSASCDYAGWANYVVSRIREYSRGKTGLDVACGSGQFTRALKKAGFNVSGVDISEQMLAAAQTESAKQRLVIPYILGDITKLKVNCKADFITAVNDGFNYLSQAELKKGFARMNACLKRGGVFMFDVSSEYKLKTVIANNTFFEDEPDYSYIWANELFSDRVEMSMSVFLRRGEHYIKREAEKTEYIHTEQAITEALTASGFAVEVIEGENGEKKHEKSERLNFIAIKQ